MLLDLDNLIKFVLDALKGAAYHDDAQVVQIISSKRYGQVAQTQVKISVVDDYQDL